MLVLLYKANIHLVFCLKSYTKKNLQCSVVTEEEDVTETVAAILLGT